MASVARTKTARNGWTAEQWRAMRSPHRVHLLAALQALGEASVSEVAAVTGRTRQSIYPHLADMARVGIIGAVAGDLRGRQIARFRFLPEVLARSVDPSTGRGLRAGADVSARALRDAMLRCHRWGKVADGRPIDFSRNPQARTSIRVAWLDERSRAELNRLFHKAGQVLMKACRRRKGQRTCVLMYHFPDYTAAEARRALASAPARRRSR